MKKKGKHKKKALSGNYQKRLRFYQSSLRKYPTIAEVRFKYALCKYYQIKFEFEYSKDKLPFQEQRQFHFPKQNKAYIVDFYIPKHKIAFEVDGNSHIGKEGYDWYRNKLLSKRKIKVFRITNEQTVDIDYVVEFIKSAINKSTIKGKAKKRKRPVINLSRKQELAMQEKFIRKHGVTRIASK